MRWTMLDHIHSGEGCSRRKGVTRTVTTSSGSPTTTNRKLHDGGPKSHGDMQQGTKPYAGRKGKMVLEMIDERQQGTKPYTCSSFVVEAAKSRH
ncbi:DNA-polymerase III polC-type [Sesbania bispinosa]|nr:DNA-polymerase III polC-type [Sesbania bispinosa]